MAQYVILRDRRLMGGVPNRPNLGIINTDETIPLYSAFQSIVGFAKWGRLDALFLCCHGFCEKYEYDNKMTMEVGTADLALGREGMNHNNVAMWAAIRDKTKDIVVYACYAADTRPGLNYVGSSVDGMSLMRKLAQYTNATVYASTQAQYYSHGSVQKGTYDFGAWEGPLYRYSPNGATDRVANASTELSKVLM